MSNPVLSSLILPVKDQTTGEVTNVEYDLPASGSSMTVDDEISSTSTNPVQNKVISEALDKKANTEDLGTAATRDVPTNGNANVTQVVLGSDTRLTNARPASDVYDWAKKATKPAYTAAEVGAIPSTAKGANSGVAELDANGKVPSSQLPSFVDDVLEYASINNFPTTGEAGKIYIALNTNQTYRWSGSAYVVISPSLALGETSSTAYRGDRGKTAYDHSQTTSGNPHNVTKSDVGLGNVGNFKAVSTVASQGLTDTEKSNARANIGAGTSSFSGSYNDLTNKPTIPTVNNATLTIQKNGTNVQTFTANQSSNATANITVPTKVSELTNDSGYTTNTGTVTQVKVGSTAYNPSSGVVSLPAYPTNTDTKNTAGSTNTSSKIFLIGATSQAANPQTYSHDTAYVGTDGCLYSGGSKVLTAHDGNNRKSFYGTCSTAAGTAAKVVTLSDTAGWELKAGTMVAVKFTNTNTASSVTLNVNSSGAKSIYYNNAVYTGNSSAVCGYANRVSVYVYDGTYWVWVGHGIDDNTTYSAMSSSELTTGTATTLRTVRADYLKSGINTLISPVADKVSLSSDAYSTSEKYTPGEVCIYDNKLYVCHTTCTPAAWSVNKSCFSQTSLTAQMKSAMHWDRNQGIKGALSIGTVKQLSEISVGEYCNYLGFSTQDAFLLNVAPKKITTAGLFDLCVVGNKFRKISENGVLVLNYDDIIVEEITLASNVSFAADEVKSYTIPAKTGYASYLMFPYVTESWADKYAIITSYPSSNGFGIWNRASSAYTWTVKATVLRKKTY